MKAMWHGFLFGCGFFLAQIAINWLSNPIVFK